MSRIAAEISKFLLLKTKLEAKGACVETIDAHGFVVRQSTDRVGGKFDLLTTALVHGDEVVGIEGLNLTLERILSGEKTLSLDVGFLLGNVAAAKAEARFLEVDMNRSFLLEQVSLPEHKRAAEIATLVERASFVIDHHQTVQPTLSPFFIFEHRADLIQLARSYDATLPIATFPSMGFSHSGKTILEMASAKNIPAVTVEWGQMGFSSETAKRLSDFIFGAVDNIASREYLGVKVNSDLKVYYLSTWISNSPGAVLRPNLVSCMDIAEGEVLGSSDAGPIVSPVAGKLFFPKYGALAKVSAELCEIGIEMSATAQLMA